MAARYEYSASGDRLYPLTKGLYVTVSTWMGQPKIHIRAYVNLKKEQSVTQNSGSDNLSTLTEHTENSPRRLYPTKRGVLLDEDGFHKLMALHQSILEEVDTKKRQLEEAEDDQNSAQPYTFSTNDGTLVGHTLMATGKRRMSDAGPLSGSSDKEEEVQTTTGKRRLMLNRRFYEPNTSWN